MPTTALIQEPFEAMCIRNDRRHLARLAFIRAVLAANAAKGIDGGKFDSGDRLVYVISRSAAPDRDKYPWRVTTFSKNNPDGSGELWPLGHTVHQFLDLEQDWGCYYKSAVWEIAWSIAEPTPMESVQV
jgi:hypothetical protein